MSAEHKTKSLWSDESDAAGNRVHGITCKCGWMEKSHNAAMVLAAFNKHVRESR